VSVAGVDTVGRPGFAAGPSGCPVCAALEVTNMATLKEI
jgi:hypothetical protein